MLHMQLSEMTMYSIFVKKHGEVTCVGRDMVDLNHRTMLKVGTGIVRIILYISIWRANQVIEALERIKDTVSGDEIETWNIQMGHARFIRGLMYFYLHSSFNNGSVVLRTSTAQSFNLPLSPAEDVL